MVLERGKSVLEKVRISGGGRCNVTHACFEPRTLVGFYPRGHRELLGPFMQFGPADTIEWFGQRGVRLKTEADGRMFPVTDSSATIAECLMESARRAGVVVKTASRVSGFTPTESGKWRVELADAHQPLLCDQLMIATGSSAAVWEQLQQLGHAIVPPVPSLFTFNTKDTRLRDLSGVSLPKVLLRVPGQELKAEGPLLVTHRGLSGPAILRLSAWGARVLNVLDYRFPLLIQWTGDRTQEEVKEMLQEVKQAQARKIVTSVAPFGLPARLWGNLVEAARLPEGLRWADMTKIQMDALYAQVHTCEMAVAGKNTFKEEFVTAGGVALREIDFKRFASRLFPNLYIAGEALDIDAITGGFNFQAAWTGGWLAGKAMGEASIF
jgi:predicted Rossmann fold flavoprotein